MNLLLKPQKIMRGNCKNVFYGWTATLKIFMKWPSTLTGCTPQISAILKKCFVTILCDTNFYVVCVGRGNQFGHLRQKLKTQQSGGIFIVLSWWSRCYIDVWLFEIVNNCSFVWQVFCVERMLRTCIPIKNSTILQYMFTFEAEPWEIFCSEKT
jgi:hypothetical protein